MESNLPQAQAEVWNLTFGFLKSMSLKCALELGIPDAISNNGQAMSLRQLHGALSLAPSKIPHLRRLMRSLTHFGFFVEKSVDVCNEPVYDLTAQSRLLIRKDESNNLLPFVRSHLDSILVKPSLYVGDWFMQEEKKVPFELAHDCTIWDLASQDPIINKMFNDAMMSSSCLFTNVIVKHGGDIFEGVGSLVDVGGGRGALAEVIAKNFPHIKCTVLDLPHVIRCCPTDGRVQFVSGDMFNCIPPADVVLLKVNLTEKYHTYLYMIHLASYVHV
jgi:O-methyltransferase domain/Dimerisation domain